ncbi:MAG: PEP-CTERM sorting domain-containing protein [Phycisphaerales bacterium]|nr:PEP-CTERM sorting domain-containing protein [Phycisphaerales bacterium]
MRPFERHFNAQRTCGPRFDALAALCVLGFSSPTVLAQWTVTNLHPPGDWSGSLASGTSASRTVGSVEPGGGVIGKVPRYASLWGGTAESWVNLHPDDEFWTHSDALGISGHQQVGHVIHVNIAGPPVSYQRACHWSGTAASLVFLADSPSSALATSGTNQVGWVFVGGPGVRASLWSGTSGSRVDLHPLGASSSSAEGIWGLQQVGSADLHAGLWHGTAESWVDIHPAAAMTSIAVATSGAQQVGDAVVGGQRHASLWSGTAASWVDLNPAGALESSASGLFGGWQVGDAAFSNGSHASLWSGTAESWEDLSLSLTGSWGETFATGIWSGGSTLSVTGYGYNLQTERTEALLWTRPVPAPSAFAVLGLGGLVAARRRRRSTPGA